ncbi:MAG: Lrp/AsnC family transcriptional regulator [Paludibacteraceae bacterium]|nr:Lrp/AsnC family transcriptional regulator [Paludibacteraceae bacterium]
MNLDKLDLKILSILSENAKTPFLEIARICNVSGAAIHQHIQHLTSIGVIKGSVFLLEPSLIGYNTCAFISVNLQPDADIASIAEELKKLPEIVECHITSGKSSLLLKVYTADNASLLELLSKIHLVSGIISTNITISLKEEFARQIGVKTSGN